MSHAAAGRQLPIPPESPTLAGSAEPADGAGWRAPSRLWFVLIGIALVTTAMVWRATQTYQTGVFDLYPLYYGAKAWLLTGNAYDIRPVAPAEHAPFGLYQTGNIYPLPAVLLALPLSFLSPQMAGTLWIGLLVAGLLLGLGLNRFPLYYLLYLPLLEGLRIEQFTIAITILQLVALWAWRERRPWALALCCALIATKPNQGLIFALALIVLARNWRQQAVVGAIVWGGAFLLDPTWFFEWLPALENHRVVQHQSIPWLLAGFALPLLLARDYVGGAVMLQFLILPYPGVYAATAAPLSVLGARGSVWLVAIAACWPIVALLGGQVWATALTLLLPATLLSLRVHRAQLRDRWHAVRRVASPRPA